MPRKLLAFTLVLFVLVAFKANAQTPGGIPVASWYRADAPGTLFSDAGTTTVTNNTTVYQWNDYTGAGFNFLQPSAGSRPVFSNATTLANFNPTVTFDGSNDWMQFTAGTGVNVIDRASGTLYAAGYMNQQKRSGFLGFHATMDYPGLHFFNNYKLLFYTGGPGYQGISTDVMQANTYFSSGTGWQNGAGSTASYAGATVSLNGSRVMYGGSELNNANLSTGARDLRIGADNNWGSFSGQLNEILVFEDRLTSDQMDRVETYLAIKYGTTYAKGLSDYKSATGSTVWSAATNNGYHYNIAGIARDDQGALYQKQSWSTSQGSQVLIGIGTLANTNAANAATLSDGQYLVWGDNGLAKVPTVTTSLFTGLSHRFAAIWKVQNTGMIGTVRVAWPKGFSNLSLIQSADATIDASDIVTGMSANEVTINGVVYNYADVTLADGAYFTFGAKLSAPGGVTAGLVMWHKANDGTTTSGAKNIWKDISGNGRDVTQNNNASYQPALVTDASYAANAKKYSFNFNPFYYFDGTNDFFYRLDNNYFSSTSSPGSVYGVMHNSAATGWRTAYGWGDDDPNLVRSSNNYLVTRDNGTVINVNANAGTLPAHIGGTAWKGSGAPNNGIYLNVNGQIYSTPSYNIGTLNSAGSFAIGSEGYDLAGNGNEVFQGGISEVFAYNIDHQNSGGDEKQRINSYLAIKYGITLKDEAGTGTGTYLSSASTVVWDPSLNTGYNNNIAGLTNDVNSALDQKQSQSNQPGQQVLISSTGLANTNALNGISLTDGQYLVWGDNGLPKVPATGIAGVPNVNYRFAAVWKVQNTGTIGTVRVSWPTGLVNLTLLQGNDPTFTAGVSSTDMSVNIITVNGVAYNYADVTLTNGEYFTFASQLNGPGGVGADLRVWLRSDAGFDPANWTDFSGNSNDYTQTNSSRQPFTAAKQYNFNPIIDFGTTGADARFMVLPSGKPYTVNGTSSTLFTASISKTASGYTDIIGFGGTTTGTGLINANAPTFTKLNDNLVLYPYTTAPALPAIELNRLYLDDVSYTVGVSGIKYGQNGQTASTAQTFAAGNALFANGSILGAQPEVRNGLIGEVIAYQRDLTDPEKERVRSYVAIKYGITLPHNYVASNGVTVFWNIGGNIGYNNNIAGIARDDYGSLGQKQSQSINKGAQVLISTTGLAESNAANSQLLNDQQFLTWGDNNLVKAPTVPIAGITGVNNRFAAIWKIQNTNTVGTVRVAWPKGYVNLKLIQSLDEIFTSSDVFTDMAGSQVVNGIEYAFADVTLSDGQYFTFAVNVQTPAGVGIPAVWLRADEGTNTIAEGEEVDQWINYGIAGGVTEALTINGTPNFQNNVHNFNPAILDNTTGVDDGLLLRDVFPTYTHHPLSTFVLQSQPTVASQRTMISFGSSATSSASLDVPWFAGNASRLQLFWQDNYEATPTLPGSQIRVNNVPSINSFYMPQWISGTHTSTISMNGALATLSGGVNATRPIGNQLFIHGDGGNNNVSEGSISEIISYDRDLTAVEKQRINSYLAVKYGITLRTDNGAAVPNYLSSNEGVVWDASNTTFNNNIAGLGRDVVLHQKQSKSININPNNQVTIGLGDIAENNFSNINALTDGQYLLWGDNGNTTAMTNTAGTYTNLSYGGTTDSRRMNRVWKVQNTGVASDVKIRFPVASVGTTTLTANDACAAYSIIYADDAAFTTNVNVVPLTANGSDYETTHIFPNGASYFTFGKATPVSSGVVYLPDVVESTTQIVNNCGIGTAWSYFRKSDDATLKLLATADVATAPLTVTITPEGTTYDNGTILTKLMPRIATITDATSGTYPGLKVRVYYNADELSATQVPGAITNSWFKYSGDAEAVLTDVYSDGKFDPSTAIALTPDASGVEDGIHYVEFHNITSFSSFIYLSSTQTINAVLPVDIIGFTAKVQDNNVLLNWTTASESNNKGFDVERSADGLNWSSLGFVASKAINGNSSATLTYNYTDKSPSINRSYYRLKQTDLDGRIKYSGIRVVDPNGARVITVLPNPVHNTLMIQGLVGRSTISVFDLNGKLVKIVQTKQDALVQIDVSQLPAGMYLIKAEDAAGKKESFKVIKQ